MKQLRRSLSLLSFAIVAALAARAQPALTLKGTVTDPSGAFAPNTLVQLRGAAGEQRTRSDLQGAYQFVNLKPGDYTVRFILKGFTVTQKKVTLASESVTLDAQLAIEASAQVVTVEEDAAALDTDPASNAGAIVLREKELAALSDDPDELQAQLQALAGPSAGPNGGQIYIDGFTGGNLPPKASIREVRVNTNPFSAEYERPGFGRIEILTRPGSDRFRGQAFFQFNNEKLNSRSPLYTAGSLPPYEQKFYGFNLSGPLKKNKASFGFDVERRATTENAFIYATTLDTNLFPQTVNEAVLTPQTRTTLSPRLDYTINANNTLVFRYQHSQNDRENVGTGDFSLASRGYNTTSKEDGFQATETMILGARAVNETRFQFRRDVSSSTGDQLPVINVSGAFIGGGNGVGLSGTEDKMWEMTNITTFTRGSHVYKWGGRLRQNFVDSTSAGNFGGTYTFFGGTGPALDENNLPIAGTSLDLTALERYRRTLLFQSMGLSADLIRAYGGGASQFTLNAGTPLASISQFDLGLFFNDDWRLRRNVTLSYGLRYETQTNIGDYSNLAPRVAVAWGIDAKGNRAARTILRAGAGVFYDRVSDSVALNALRYNGVTQQSYRVMNPDFYPAIPAAASLAASALPQQLQLVYAGLKAPRSLQSNIGIERQMGQYVKLSVNYINTRSFHSLITRDINAPINGAYPFGDSIVRLLTESTGSARLHQLVVSPNVNYKKLFLFGFYGLGYGRDNVTSSPADPYNLAAEWGPSSFGDVRHRYVIGTSIPLPFRISANPFISGSSGSPYNITTGLDTNKDGFTNERPALLSGLTTSSCTGSSLLYAAGFGCFDLNPAAGTSISRNYARGPANFTVNLRLQRSWSFGERKSQSDAGDMMGGPGGGPPPGGGGGMRGGGGGMRGGGPGGGGPPMMGGLGPGGMGGMRNFGASSTGRYNLTLSLNAQNLLNHANYGAPGGDLSSPYFGVYRSLAGGFGPMSGGASTYNRKLDLQLRLSF